MTPFRLAYRLASLSQFCCVAAGRQNGPPLGEHAFRAGVLSLILAASRPESLRVAGRECRAALTSRLHEGWVAASEAMIPDNMLLRAVVKEPWQHIPAPWQALQPPTDTSIAPLAVRFVRFLHEREAVSTGLDHGVSDDFPVAAVVDPLYAAMADYAQQSVFSSATHSIHQRAITSYYSGSPEYFLVMTTFDQRHGNARLEIFDRLVAGGSLRVPTNTLAISDVGCGTANLGFHIAQRATRALLTRIDVNRQALHSFPGGNHKSVFVHNHLTDFTKRWPMDTASQDLVLLGEVLEHTFDPRWLVREAARVLKADGQVIVSVPNAWHWQKIFRFLFRQRLEKTLTSDHIRYFSRHSLRELLEQNGFAIDEVLPFSLRWPDASSVRGRVARTYSRIPLCARNYLAVASLQRPATTTPEEDLKEEAAAIVNVILATRVGLRHQFTPFSSESVSQGATRIALMVLSSSQTLGVDPDESALAVIYRGLIESTIAAFSPELRLRALQGDGAGLLRHALRGLPKSTSDRLLARFEELTDTLDWKLVSDVFTFELEGRSPAGLAAAFGASAHVAARLYFPA